jgi:hypothetical protein
LGSSSVNTCFLLWHSTEVGGGIPLAGASAGKDHPRLSLLSLSCAAAQPAFQELSTTENADTTTSMSATLETNAARAESAYRKTLQDFVAGESTSSTARWDMDRYDRVY